MHALELDDLAGMLLPLRPLQPLCNRRKGVVVVLC
jgi:hypothetical protein